MESKKEICFTCGGSGLIFRFTSSSDNTDYWKGSVCTSCNGGGRITEIKETVRLEDTGEFYEGFSNKIIHWDYNRAGEKVIVGISDKKD